MESEYDMMRAAWRRLATRPTPLAVLGLMFGLLGLMTQINIMFGDSFDFTFPFICWVIGVGIVLCATWMGLAEASEKGRSS